ncbi:unnamed protein product [Lactuca saligna]|uniref:Uncharacterized protein n=1 Tax=Lactuca saligna TaxID=75948 RepID=A0AA36E6U8_LACSI|nr:unnamed protein product [Lactuca saligna]
MGLPPNTMNTIMQKLVEQLQTMKISLAHLQQTYTTITTTMHTLLEDAPDELLYKELIITNHISTDVEQDSALMLDTFETMHT